MSWELRRLSGTVRELHARSPAVLYEDQAGGRLAQLLEPTDHALVLGSGQPDTVADMGACRAAGADVVRRRSGGGAVLVVPGHLMWVDIFVPAVDALWDDDVGKAAWWVGETWARALGRDLSPLEVWKGPMLRRPFSSLVCFAGLGPGEITFAGGPKLVGVSQRRARAGALFQCACILQWRPKDLLSLLALPEPERVEAETALSDVAVGLGPKNYERLVEQLVDALP